jgi:hypothetical protein
MRHSWAYFPQVWKPGALGPGSENLGLEHLSQLRQRESYLNTGHVEQTGISHMPVHERTRKQNKTSL